MLAELAKSQLLKADLRSSILELLKQKHYGLVSTEETILIQLTHLLCMFDIVGLVPDSIQYPYYPIIELHWKQFSLLLEGRETFTLIDKYRSFLIRKGIPLSDIVEMVAYNMNHPIKDLDREYVRNQLVSLVQISEMAK